MTTDGAPTALDLSDTPLEYRRALELARGKFSERSSKYGPSWLLLRPVSITDQALIKAFRIRKVGIISRVNKVGESIDEDIIALINYATMGVYIVRNNAQGDWPAIPRDLTALHGALDAIRTEAARLLVEKNHDYDEAWRQFRLDTFVDLITTKLYRIRSLEAETSYPVRAVCAEWLDVLNYACLLEGTRVVAQP